MEYTRFRINDFKGIRQLDLDLSTYPRGRIFPLVGLNESGKTTILEALDYLQLGIDDSDPLDLLGLDRDDHHDLIPISQRGNFNGSIEISVDVELSDDDEKEIIDFLKEQRFRTSNMSTLFTITDKYNFENSTYTGRKGVWTFNPSGRYHKSRTDRPLYGQKEVWRSAVQFLKERMPSIWYFPNFLFDFPRRINLGSEQSDDAKERFYHNLLRDILSAVDPTATLEQHVAKRIGSDNQYDQTALRQLLLQLERQIKKDVFESWNEIFQRPTATEASFTAGIDDVGNKYLELSIEDTDGLHYIDERSLGFRWFFVFSLVTKYKRSGSEKSQGIVYLFDEPASNLHAGAQSQLLKSLERLSSDRTIIYTTHSHHLINPHWLENTYVVRNRGFDLDSAIESTSKGTDITIERYRSFANKHPDQTRYFQPILEVLDYKPSELELAPDIVMVEGKNDFYTLAYISRVIFGQRSDTPYMAPGDGAGSLDSIIQLYFGWAKNFVVLLDSDEEGENQKQRYLRKFGPILENRIFTLGDLITTLKGKSLEEAFETSDREAIIAPIHPSEQLTKQLFNRSVQERLVRQQSVQLSATTMDRFESLLAQLKEALAKTTGS